MRRLSERTETSVRLGALHLVPAVIGAALILWAFYGDAPTFVRAMLPAWLFLVGEGMFCFGESHGVDLARGDVREDDAGPITEHPGPRSAE